MLVLTRKKDEVIVIGDDIEIIITDIGEDKVKIGITAPQSYKIFRKELLKEVSNTNIEASTAEKIDTNLVKEILIKKKD